MSVPLDLEVVDDLAILRLTGDIAIADAASRVTEALMYAREQQIRKLLVSTLDVAIHGAPTVAGSYFRIQEWARAADGFVRLAMVLPPHLFKPQGVGMTMAANSGLIGNIFTTEDDALRWLHAAESRVGQPNEDPKS